DLGGLAAAYRGRVMLVIGDDRLQASGGVITELYLPIRMTFQIFAALFQSGGMRTHGAYPFEFAVGRRCQNVIDPQPQFTQNFQTIFANVRRRVGDVAAYLVADRKHRELCVPVPECRARRCKIDASDYFCLTILDGFRGFVTVRANSPLYSDGHLVASSAAAVRD